MVENIAHDALRLHAESPDARSQIADAVDRLLASPDGSLRLSITLEGGQLPAGTVASLITALRRLREHGGAIQVTPASAPIAEALQVNGLHRVFAFPLDPEAQRTRRHGLLRRLAAASFAALLGVVGIPATAADDHATDPAAILAKVVERNPNLNSYQGRLHVDLRLKTFPFLAQHLEGTTYYKKPSNYEVVFDRVPPLAKGFDKMFTDIGDPANWERRFHVSYEGEHDYNGRKDVQLRLVQRVRGMIDHETVLIDPKAWTIDSIRYDYYNGGHITMTQSFREVGGYLMLAEQNAEIAIPYARAAAHGVYTDYKTNVAIDDAVFTKKN